MTTLFGIAFLLAILALIEGICICTKRKLHNQKRPASCYVLLSALELRPDWKAELNHLFSDLQWQVSLQTAEIFCCCRKNRHCNQKKFDSIAKTTPVSNVEHFRNSRKF